MAWPISASLRPGNTVPFEEMSQWWRAVGNTVSDLTGPRFEPRPTAPETNALLLDQLAGLSHCCSCYFVVLSTADIAEVFGHFAYKQVKNQPLL